MNTAPAGSTTGARPKRTNRIRNGLALAALLAVTAGLALFVLPRIEAHFAVSGPPGATALESPLVFHGRVLERLQAGRYAYLHIASEDGARRWIVSIRPPGAAGERVTARAVTRAHDFESRRLARTFEDLYFGSIELTPHLAASPSSP